MNSCLYGCFMGGGAVCCTMLGNNTDLRVQLHNARQRHEGEIDDLRVQHGSALTGAQNRHRAEIADLRVQHTSALTTAQQRHKAEIEDLRVRNTSALTEVQREVGFQTSIVVRLREEIIDKEKLLRQHDSTIRSLQVEILEKDARIEALSRQGDKASPEHDGVESSSGLSSFFTHCFDESPMRPGHNRGEDATSSDDFSSQGSFEVVNSSALQESKCFMPNTGFLSATGHMLRVEALKIGDEVRLYDGRTASITRVHVHEWGLQDIRVLRTSQGNFEVSSSQLIVVFQSGAIHRRKAGELQVGDTVFVGKRKQRLLNVLPKKQRTSLYAVSYDPDGQVEAFMVSPWGIHAYGEPTEEQALGGPLEDAIQAVQQVATNGSMTSEWTSALAFALREPSEAELVRKVLQKYSWTGTQFATPPDRAALLEDLLKVKKAAEERRHDDSRTEATEGARESGRFLNILHAMANIPENDLRNAMPAVYED